MTDAPTPSRTIRSNPAAEQFAVDAARLLADSNCDEVIVMDLRGLSPITDYFVIASGTSSRQMKSVADDLKLLARQRGQGVFGVAGEQSCQWVIADFIDVVVHLFDAEHRAYYDLESLWGDSKRVDWASRTRPGQFANLRAKASTVGGGDD